MTEALTVREAEMTEALTVIGDIHGRYYDYREITRNHPWTIQLGDFGIGFPSRDAAVEAERQAVLADAFAQPGQHQFFRGNHDNPAECLRHPHCIEDGTFWEDGKIMIIGGAWSIDYAYRIPDVSWWEDEQLSYNQLSDLIVKYEQVKPDIVLTHDGPSLITEQMFVNTGQSLFPGVGMIKTRTGEALQAMFDLHQPKLWVFGHWHITKQLQKGNTQFTCLGECGTAEINVSDATLEIGTNYRSGVKRILT